MKGSGKAGISVGSLRWGASSCLVALALNLSACGWFDQDWERWEAFHKHFVQDDGRVIDRTDGARSTSEGQAYGLFFALVANRPDVFASVLSWTCLLYTSPSPRDGLLSRMPSSA